MGNILISDVTLRQERKRTEAALSFREKTGDRAAHWTDCA
jgi:hypothetical protein